MKPPAFDYVRVVSVEEAVATLAKHGQDAAVLAGGQSLLPLTNMRLARPGVLVDVNRVPGLDRIEANGALTLGALVRQADALASREVASFAPVVAEALRHVGHAATRSRGTIGGSVAHADPAAELPALLLAFGGEVVLRSPRGERAVPAGDFFVGRLVTAREPDELVTAVRLPRPAPGTRFGFAELARRHGDFALAGAVVALGPEPRVVLFGVAQTPVRAGRAESSLAGGASVAEAARLAAEGLDPLSDVHAPGEYRARMAAVVARRALEQAGG